MPPVSPILNSEDTDVAFIHDAVTIRTMTQIRNRDESTSSLNVCWVLWRVDCHKLQSLQKKALRFMTNSSYIAHTAPLLVKHGLLHVHDMFKLKLLKFYYKLSYDLLPSYFISYSEILTHNSPRELRHYYIHAPLVKLAT